MRKYSKVATLNSPKYHKTILKRNSPHRNSRGCPSDNVKVFLTNDDWRAVAVGFPLEPELVVTGIVKSEGQNVFWRKKKKDRTEGLTTSSAGGLRRTAGRPEVTDL